MPQIGIFVLVHIFSAVLPQDDLETDGEFYAILGLDKGATTEQIRKAYKKKSLALHPDKIAQRRASPITKEQAAAEYEKVQEAYGVLMNDDKRQRYHALQCSVTRYKFVSKGTLANPGALLENLSKSSFVDKTRLVALCSILLAIVWIQPVLVATKINHVLEARGGLQDTKWVVIGLPFFLLYALVILFWSGLAFLVPPSARISLCLWITELVLWYVAILQSARAWDGAFGEDVKYGTVFIPVYLALIARWMQAVATLHTIRADVNRMISLDFLEEEVLKGKHLEELTEDERLLLMKEFLLVTVPPDFEPDLPEEENAADIEAGTAEDLKKKRIEEQKVASSPEYEAATEMYNETFGNLVSSIVFGSIFVLLVVLKLDGPITGANWWTVFTPIWVYLGSLVMYYTSACLFGSSVTGDEIVLVLQQKQQQQDKEKQDKENEDNQDKTKDGEEEKEEEKTDKKEQPKTVSSTAAAASYDETAVSPKDPRHDSAFVEADASVGRFHKSKGKNNKDGGEDAPEDEKDQDEKRKTSPKSSKVGASESNDHATIQTKDSKNINTKATNDSTKDEDESKKGDGDEGEDEDDDDPIRLDEESFKAFQSAYAAAEQNAMEEQAKASSSCCTTCLQLLILCLVVAKLDKGYDAAQDGDTQDVGFNTYWILFPFLLFCGLLCCTCACLIYGVSGDLDLHGEDGAESNRPDTSNGGNNDSNHDAESPSPMIIPPPPPAASSTNTTAESSSQPTTTGVSVDSDKNGGQSSATDTKQNSSIGSVPVPDVQHASSSLDDLD